MSLIQNVAGTAFVAAECRADENREDNPLYLDPVVSLFLDEESKRVADRIFVSFPQWRSSVRVRTRYVDDWLDRQLQRGFRQVAILGAGLDTRAQRKASPGVAYFEIDNGATLAFKSARLRENGLDPGVVYISGDYVADDLTTLLRRNGFDFSLPTHFIWEGNTAYLDATAVALVLDGIAQNLRRFSISFDYVGQELIANETGDPETAAVVARFAAMGAPWTFGVSDIESLADTIGAQVADRFSIAELYRRYWPGKTPDSRIFDYYWICTLEGGQGDNS
ncbi:SAM-dependent methyltransferase [Methylosinus sp. Sm6]|uniref:class I SAM-dependent methyltransferase n=1 Tax=Methylosinus sp. Sm6 TaxID=2866948 RepID=UPI001C998612|nr:SAM-dependent methyltransferase [Methylosinus sp. Sm6]MBY6242609.1 SAM-dependent methyltransferase [Methylosinus sp. Sm6]